MDYFNDENTKKLDKNAPIVICIHTGCGNSKHEINFLKESSKRGWRGCVINRRSCGNVLKTPKFNLMGDI